MGEAIVPSDTAFDAHYHLAFGDVQFNSTSNPTWMEVRIKHLKCTQFCKGVTVSVGTTKTSICPVAAMLGYLVQRGVTLGPLFTFADGRPLTRECFVSALRLALEVYSMDSSAYAGHSCHVGVATAIAARGLQDSLIKTLGHWDSSAYTVYIRNPRVILISVAKSLVK